LPRSATLSRNIAPRNTLPGDLRFRLRLQLGHDLATGKPVTAEAWPSWLRAGRPFPAAAVRDHGLATHALLRAAAEQALRPRAVPVSINADAATLADGSLAEAASSVIAQTGCPPERLRIEIPEPVLETLDPAPLASLGLGLVADHVGTGAMSLRLLAALPLAAIKLDASLVREIGHSRPRQALVQALATVAAMRSITLAACGIEDEEERAVLAALGVGTGQGPLFASQPLPV
jgi:EAL domain-containing protein (putative c-di-GMP-specific phosphodiesterase class I)